LLKRHSRREPNSRPSCGSHYQIGHENAQVFLRGLQYYASQTSLHYRFYLQLRLLLIGEFHFPFITFSNLQKNKAMIQSKNPLHALFTPKEQLVTGVTLGYVRPIKRGLIWNKP